MSIQDYLGRIKPKLPNSHTETVSFDNEGNIEPPGISKHLFLPLITLLVISLAFGLGRLSKETSQSKIKLDYDTSLSGNVLSSTNSNTSASTPKAEPSAKPSLDSQTVVASIKGTKYHYLYCPGAKQISEANKITFKNAALAEAAGYTLALNCKPR